MVGSFFVVLFTFFAAAFAVEPNCGISKSSKGFETEHGQYPWIAAMEYIMENTEYSVGIKCGGALINNRFVLTAAQCLHINNLELDSVWLGVRKLSDADRADVDKVRKFGIEKLLRHENYDEYKRANDIALLKLDKDVDYTDYIKPICLPEQTTPLPTSGTYMFISGWGQTRQCGPTTNIKLQLEVPMYSHSDCVDLWNVPVRGDEICTSGNSLQGDCWRDTGVPIMESRPVGVNKRWFATGIVTSNEVCTNTQAATHTRVSSYATWMERTMASN